MRITSLCFLASSGLLRLITDGGLEGWCPSVPVELQNSVLELFSDLLVGQSPIDRERLWQAMVERATQRGRTDALWGYVDVALWDLLGKALNQPVFRLIGGYRDRVPVAKRGQALDDLPAVVHEATLAQKEGFLGYLDRFGGSVKDTATLARHLREAVGPDFYLMHDGQRRYAPAEALSVGRALQAQDYHWFESPLQSADGPGLKRLAEALDVPVLDGVTGHTALLATAQLIGAQAVDMTKVSVPASGGITDALKIARLAGAFGNHCEFEFDATMGGCVHAHLMGALNNACFFRAERSGPQSGGPGFASTLCVEGGYLALPTEPGLGLRICQP
jgi:L-alanine-DL-glutamate epimerase-like enolase superfamily enzyme